MNNDIDILARTIFGEAKANSTADAEAIANVVMNRCMLPNWPSTPAEVCQQAWQFSCWNTNDPNRARIMNASGDWFKKCQSIARKAVTAGTHDMTNRATHYCTPTVKTKTYWAKDKQPCYQTDGHLFFNDIDTPPPANAKEALDQQRPLTATKTVRGGQVASVGTGGAMIAEIGQQVTEAAYQIQGLTYYLSIAKWAFFALIIAGIGFTLWARIKDRQDGVK
ncbi:MAG: cell wall hydrolase [Thalassospira sp.]|uniref:cell wall hydrolase n=1 Tax=Thalassospira sp. TaxID=1912094 RepID=UPI0032EE489B